MPGERMRPRRRALAMSLVVTALAALVFAARVRVRQQTLWQGALWFLVGLEVVYGVTVVATAVAIPALVVVLRRARRRGRRPGWAARGLLLCVSLVLGLGLAEAYAGLRQARAPHLPPPRRPTPQAPGLSRLIDPREIALPATFANDDGDGAVELVVVGESSAEGVPYNFWLSIGELVRWQLQEAIPPLRVRLNVLAVSGDTLEGQHRKLARLTRRPDVLLVYCGHNEFSARFPWSRDVFHYVDEPPPSLGASLVERLERTSPVCGLIRRTADKCRIAIPPPPEAARALVDVPSFSPAEYEALRVDFERRLERIVAYAERLRALTVLIIPAANDAGFEPNRSFLPPRTAYAERTAFARDFRAVRRGESADPAWAIREYRALLKRQPGFAEAHYRLARLLERTGDRDEAYRHDVAARDHDGAPVRCLTSFQDAYRTVAARHACVLIDAQAYFHAIGDRGLLDDDLFHDAMHPSFRGQIALAQAVLQGLKARRAFGWPEESPAPEIDPKRCAARFGLNRDAWMRLCLWGVMAYDRFSPMHYDPTRRRAKQDAFGQAYERIKAGAAPEQAGLPNIGVPRPVPLVPHAAVLTRGPSA
jgi:lysophospholipase L1-like esterase